MSLTQKCDGGASLIRFPIEIYGNGTASGPPTWLAMRHAARSWLILAGPAISAIKALHVNVREPTGWIWVDRGVDEARLALSKATVEEQFQSVGLLCREALISCAQEVHDPLKHPQLDGVGVSQTDFKRLIEAYIAVELGGSAAEEVRKYARSALDLAVRLQHKRTANFLDAAICLEASESVINVIAIISGLRKP